MKKYLALALALSMSIGLVACGSCTETTTTTTSTPATTTTTTEAAPAEEAEEIIQGEYVIKLANPSTPTDNVVKAFYYFEEILEERSGGQIDVQVYDSGQLGSHTETIDSMQMHSLQAAEISTSVLSNLVDAFSIFSLPYLVEDMDAMIEVLDTTDLADELDARLQDAANLKILGWYVRSTRSIYTNKGPVSSLADLAGTKIRIMESDLMSTTMEMLGMIPVPLSATERYMALSTGTVDAAENSVPLIITESEYEVTQYVVVSNHFCTPNVMAMDLDYFNDLPANLQELVLECAAEAGTYSSELDAAEEQAALDALESEYGMTICYLDDVQEFMDAVAPMYAENVDLIGQDIYDYFGK